MTYIPPPPRSSSAVRLMRAARVALLSWHAASAFAVIGSCFLAPSLVAQTAGTGLVEGRVQSASTGTYLNNARVRVAGTGREVFTNAHGEYRIDGLPAGQATLEVFFTGMAPQNVPVTVPASGAVQKDVVLRGLSDVTSTASDGTVVLTQFVVQSQRETDAAAIAINEQRFAANRKDVVSTDAFGEINQGNIGEFVKFLPGISLDVKDGNTPSGIMVRGFDPNYTNVTMDGGQLASTIIANTQTSSRQFVLEGANINNIARIEVTKLPTPDMSANLLGGAVNFVSRTAFERPRREVRFSTYLSANAKALEFDKSPGPLAEETYKVLPSFDFQYADPVTKKFGFVISAQHSSQYYLQNRTVFGHEFLRNGATPANPYTRNVQTNFAPNRTDRTGGAITLDYKPWEKHVVSLRMMATANKQQQASRTINYNVGGNRPRSYDENNTFGAATGGSVSLGTGFQERHALTRSAAAAWTFTGNDWKVEAAGTYSHSNNRTRDNPKGFFRSVSVNLPNVATVNLENVDHGYPRFGAATVLDRSGQRIDELRLANWNLTTAGSEALNAQDLLKEARLNVTRSVSMFGTNVAFKVGGSVNDMTRDLDYTPVNRTYVGPDGIANNADNTAGPFVSESDRGVSPGFGRPAPEWVDPFKVYQNFKNNPGHWTQTPGQAGDVPRNQAIRSPWLHETITSGYIMADTKLLKNRLRLVGGVRYELTEDEGRGFRQNPNDVLVKDAQGRVVDTDRARPGVQPQIRPELLPSGSFEYNSVMYTKRGYYAARDYHYYHPSAHATYNITENLLIRAAFAKTIGRPNLSDIVPNLFVQENLNFGVEGNSSADIPGFISGANIGLRPWRAKNYDYTVEYYLPRNGLLMFNWYRKDIRDFFSSIQQTADAALLAELGLSNEALGYRYTKRINVADARITGWEARAELPLANFTRFDALSFLGEWPSHFTLMANFTHLSLSGSRVTSSDWKRYIPRSRNLGLRFNFKKLSGNLLVNWRGKMLRDDSNAFPGANEYIRARYQFDANVEYQLTRRFGVFFAGRNLLNAASQWEVSGPGVPEWSTLTNHEDYGAQYSLGARVTF